jgi:hypothetical protein
MRVPVADCVLEIPFPTGTEDNVTVLVTSYSVHRVTGLVVRVYVLDVSSAEFWREDAAPVLALS